MTFSIAARCLDTQMFGIAIASSSPAVAARCAHARRAVGAVATQNITDPALGPRILDLLSQENDSRDALRLALQETVFGEYRQLIVVSRDGPAAVHSGGRTLGLAATSAGAHCAAAGNLLGSADVPAAMTRTFEAARGHLAARLLQALQEGLREGGEAGPIRSAGLLVVHEMSWPLVDLRMDWHEVPVAALAEAWAVYAPQMQDYVRRAVDPGAAPSFGVAGDP